MNEFDDIDRELEAAFTQRPSTMSRPSLRGVKQRARRRQRQRQAGVLSACALVGVGGVAVIAQRSPSNETTVGGLEDDPATTMCFPNTTYVVNETMPYTIPTFMGGEVSGPLANPVSYIIQAGDNPTTVAEQFGVTLEALNVANIGNPDYDMFLVGLEISIPAAIAGTYTLAAGDFPGSVAEKFKVTVAELDAVNRNVPGYGPFAVGTVINIPHAVGTLTSISFEPSATTTTGVSTVIESVCFTQIPWVGYWRCSGEVGQEAEYSFFDVCEPVSNPNTEPTVSTIVFDSTTVPFGFTKVGTYVQVINTSNQEGAAGFLANALAAEGFTMVEPDTGTIDMPITKVLYNPDDPNALPVAQTLALFLGSADVEPTGPVLPTLTLGTWAPGSGVIVLLGDDLAGKSLAQIAGEANYTTTTFTPTTTSE